MICEMRDDGYMRPTFAHGKKVAVARLLKLRQQAQGDKEPRMLLRIQGILMSLDGHTTGEIADHLRVHRSTVPLWIDLWNRYGKEGLLEGHRCGRPTALSHADRERLCDIIDSGPVAYGFPRAANAIHKRSLAPYGWTTPISSTFIRRTIFSGKPIWRSWSKWWCPRSTGAAIEST